MRLHQAAVTQHFGNKPTCLAAEGSLYHITDFGNHAICAATAVASRNCSWQSYHVAHVWFFQRHSDSFTCKAKLTETKLNWVTSKSGTKHTR